jgi:putative membrane protein
VSSAGLKSTIYLGGVLGLALLVTLFVRADFGSIEHALALAGGQILWLLPYRLTFFVLYGLAWYSLLRAYDPRGRLSVAFLTWGAAVREGIDRLLPVASIGGGVIGVRLLSWRAVPTGPAAATVVVEVLLTLVALWAFTIVGLTLLVVRGSPQPQAIVITTLAAAGLAVPAVLALLLRYGSVFGRLETALGSFVGVRALAGAAATLDREVRATLRRRSQLVVCGALQLAAMASGAFEVWFSLRLFGHPTDFGSAIIMESLTQAARHVAFLVPGALGVQELSLVFLANMLGVSADLALGVSLVKRARELVWGIAALGSWQWEEGRRLRAGQRQLS